MPLEVLWHRSSHHLERMLRRGQTSYQNHIMLLLGHVHLALRPRKSFNKIAVSVEGFQFIITQELCIEWTLVTDY